MSFLINHPEVLTVIVYVVLGLLTVTPLLNVSLYYSKLPVLLSNIGALLCGIVLTYLRFTNKSTFNHMFVFIVAELAVILYTLYSSSQDLPVKKDPKTKLTLALNTIVAGLLIVFLVFLVHMKYEVHKSRNDIVKMGGSIHRGSNSSQWPEAKVAPELQHHSPHYTPSKSAVQFSNASTPESHMYDEYDATDIQLNIPHERSYRRHRSRRR